MKINRCWYAVLFSALLAGCTTPQPKQPTAEQSRDEYYKSIGITNPDKCPHDGGITWVYGVPFCAKCYKAWHSCERDLEQNK